MANHGLSKLQKALLKALEQYHSSVSLSCKACKIGRTAFYRNYHKNKLFADQVDEIKYRIDDILEQTALSVAIKDRNANMLMFMLKTRLKDRGYLEKIQTEEVGKKQSGIIYNVKDLSDEQLAKILKEEEEPKDDF